MSLNMISESVPASLAKLGGRRLSILALVGAVVVATVLLSSMMLIKAPLVTLYSGLDQRDVSRISSELANANIAFDFNEQRTAVMVRSSDIVRARALLARSGLPASSSAGYELFDSLGSLGLTSFMQEITRLRALEGEIARTIMALDGVEDVRVHLVLPQPGLFRRTDRQPSASIVIRTGPAWRAEAVAAVRSIVASAVPGMKLEHVSVANANGQVLATGGDPNSIASHTLSGLEAELTRTIEERASRTLAPILGIDNYRISGSVVLDMDRQKVAETVYDPASRVERSTRVVRQRSQSENSTKQPAVGVDANLPEEPANPDNRERAKKNDDKREETTNFEISSKRIDTERQGYRIKSIAIAAVINRSRLIESLGGQATEEQINQKLGEMRRLIMAAIGFSEQRGDKIELTAMSFNETSNAVATHSTPVVAYLAMNSGVIAAALAFVAGIALVMWLAVRPALKLLAAPAAADRLQEQPTAAGGLAELDTDAGPKIALSNPDETSDGFGGGDMGFGNDFSFDSEGMQTETSAPPRDQLSELVEENQEEIARVVRGWLNEAEPSS